MTTTTKQDLLSYPVPELTADGTCSLQSSLAAEPYDLRQILGIDNLESEQRARQQLRRLHDSLEQLQDSLEADWIGIYQVAEKADATRVLVKLAYQGEPSRAEFPLTEDFALLSNNTKVGLTGQAVIVNDVAEHSGPYYVCDNRVQSEICLPIFDATGKKIVGIVDAESFQPGFFDKVKLASVTRLCQSLADHLPILERAKP